MIEAFIAVPIFFLSVLMTDWVKNVAVQAQLLALPTSRSSHSEPTPVGGGLGIVVAYLGAMLYLWWSTSLMPVEILVLCVSLPVALIGLIDDRRHVDYRVRLLVQAAGAFCALILLGEFPSIPVANFSLDLFFLVWVVVPMALLWLTNLYNFMDGIDGLAGVETCFVAGSAAFLLLQSGDLPLALVCLCLFAGATGFLVFNWPPARIFMGDVGSGFAGYSLGLVALLSHYHDTMSLWSWVLLLAVFIVDATMTLIRRTVAGRRWYHAHRTHAYQHAASKCCSHQIVSFSVLLIDMLWLLPLAWLAGKHPEYGVYLAAAGVVPLIVVANVFNAGQELS
ncbi:MAG: glycosyltransferase family 4 protein [Gammaproteobacteria bacterium]|nr:glycosyltransferase family 4 protein [Gammaproteobacteria bacterium]MDP2140900.1 glycosyltransferase family 4 protein [Gammaproteobacteria bacterium]MDP2349356.1 glycosyltransferase family 4 protein [Gammaproteobacteria bacterium]